MRSFAKMKPSRKFPNLQYSYVLTAVSWLLHLFVFVFPDEEEAAEPDMLDSEYFPQDVVQNILNNVKDKGHRSHSIFCEMDTLKTYSDTWEWRETAR